MKKINYNKGFIIQGVIAVVALLIIIGVASYLGTRRNFGPEGDVVVNPPVVEETAVQNNLTSTSKTSVTQNQPSITVLSPNGGEVFKVGSSVPVKWAYNNLPGVNTHNSELIENVEIFVIDQNGKDCKVASIPVISSGYPINASNKQGCYPLNAGSYKVYILIRTSSGEERLEDYSDNYFTITN